MLSLSLNEVMYDTLAQFRVLLFLNATVSTSSKQLDEQIYTDE